MQIFYLKFPVEFLTFSSAMELYFYEWVVYFVQEDAHAHTHTCV